MNCEDLQAKKATLIHRVLAHSYATYLIATIVGYIIYALHPLRLSMNQDTAHGIGLACMMIGTGLIFWAQSVSRKSKVYRTNLDTLEKHHFARGPYEFFRSPTNNGLFLVLFGFGFMLSSVAIMVVALLTFIITRFTFVALQEKLLEEKYGAPYETYKKSVKF